MLVESFFCRAAALVVLLGVTGCAGQTPETTPTRSLTPSAVAAAPTPAEISCPERAASPALMPGITQAQLTAEYWLARQGGPVDAVLLDGAQIHRHNAAFRAAGPDAPFKVYDLDAPLDEAGLRAELKERFDWLKQRFTDKKYVDVSGAPITASGLSLSGISLEPSLFTAQADAQIYCAPSARAYYTPSLDLRFNRNNCSMVRIGEPVQVLARWSNGMRLARTRYSYGWLAADVALAPLEHTPEIVTKPITRRGVIEAAFKRLGAPYGWGGDGGGQDCSRFLMNVFAEFGLELPRYSASQAKAGTFSVDVTKVSDETERLRLLDAAAERGITLLHFPGHIMMYLGRDEAGRAMAIHSFAEYLVPCDEGGETLLTVDRISVSDLELGRGTSRKAFIERLTKITVIGEAPGPKLSGVATLRPAAPIVEAESCRNGGSAAIYHSPRRPNRQQKLRLIVAAGPDGGPSTLRLTGPGGQVIYPELTHFGGPPHGYVATLDALPVGRWRAEFGDGDHVTACRKFKMLARRPKAETEDAGREGRPVWAARRKWSRHTEGLYATFVESLFNYPPDEDVSWKNLHSLLRDQGRNVLYDHFGTNEDEQLRLKPDCADLPYLLRAYFAWKLGLPYGYRSCSRGRAGRPPRCGDLQTNFVDRARSGDTEAFQHFANRKIRNAVHSASGRTAPDAEKTDFYPVALSRESLPPGTLFADPYGHLLIVARWLPQGTESYGVLLAADAQPDGTIGRRRFWRGSFLFSPETRDVGAGFKAFRPIVVEDDEPMALDNETLKGRTQFARFSRQQYKGTADDFYAAVEGLINPRPLDPEAMQLALVDALHEAVKRRVVSVDNGEAYMARQRRSMKMPSGYSIFETVGGWEDFATPSRDLRLLISIYTVLGFVDSARSAPARFGIDPQRLEERLAALKTVRDEALADRFIQYTGSEGTVVRLSLAQILERRAGFEMAYNPNDCVEIRWAAPDAGTEMARCRRHRPPAQGRKMRRYRAWFKARRRPPR